MTDFIVTFNALEYYNGEFGFDWVDFMQSVEGDVYYTYLQNTDIKHLEYIYDDLQNKYIDVKGNKDAQQQTLTDEYNTFNINDTDVYYIPCLSMYPNQEIELEMFFALFTYVDLSQEVISFEQNDAYIVTIEGKTNENIRYIPDGFPKEISIKCIKPSEETYIIAKDAKNNIVGTIRAKDNRTIYHLDVRAICVVEDTDKKDTEIDQLIEEFKENKIEECLNKNSLNQALIKTKVEIDKKYHLALNEDEIKDISIFLEERNSTHKTILFNKLFNKYQQLFDVGEQFKGVLMFLNYLDVENKFRINGASHGVSGDEMMIFKRGFLQKMVYAHEIGHTLGLQHFFINREQEVTKPEGIAQKIQEIDEHIEHYTHYLQHQNEMMTEIDWRINTYQNEIRELRLTDDSDDSMYKIEYLEEQIDEAEQTNHQHQKSIDKAIRDQEKYANDRIKHQKSLELFKANRYKYKENATHNIMDYAQHIFAFTQWQWEIMQRNTKISSENMS